MIKEITDKTIVDELEHESTPIINLTMNKDYRQESFEVYQSILGWYRHHEDINANSSIYKKWTKISELLGFDPIKHPTYVHRNVLWTFTWKENPVLLYYNKRGMKLQVGNKFRKSEIVPFLNHLKKLLIS